MKFKKITQKTTRLEDIYFLTNGTHKIATLKNVTYDDLVRNFGEPSINTPSGDDKVQVEWVFANDGKVFTIYDWKTFDRNYTLQELNHWSIGGAVNGNEFFECIEDRVDRTVLIQV